VHDRRGGAERQVVAVEGDVGETQRHRLVEKLAGQGVEPLGQDRAPTLDAHQRDLASGVLLDDLVRDPHERAANVIVVENDPGGLQPAAPSWPHGAWLKEPTLVSVSAPSAVQDVRQTLHDEVALALDRPQAGRL